MPIESVTLPAPGSGLPTTEATLVYLETSEDDKRLMYLHRIKHAGPDYELTRVAELYWLGLAGAMTALADEVAQATPAGFDVVLGPPSSSAHLYAPYRAVLKRRYPSALDLSGDLYRRVDVKAARSASAEEVAHSWALDAPGSIPDADTVNVLFVDDVFAAGKTAAAALYHLRAWLPDKTTVMTIACPLKTIPSTGGGVDYLALAQEAASSGDPSG